MHRHRGISGDIAVGARNCALARPAASQLATRWRVWRLEDAAKPGAARPVDWVHAPVPRDTDPQRYLAPYRSLRLPEATAPYLGVVDLADGLTGTRRRIEAAQSVLPAFGVSTVCGIGREFYSRADAIAILDLYAERVAAG